MRQEGGAIASSTIKQPKWCPSHRSHDPGSTPSHRARFVLGHALPSLHTPGPASHFFFPHPLFRLLWSEVPGPFFFLSSGEIGLPSWSISPSTSRMVMFSILVGGCEMRYGFERLLKIRCAVGWGSIGFMAVRVRDRDGQRDGGWQKKAHLKAKLAERQRIKFDGALDQPPESIFRPVRQLLPAMGKNCSSAAPSWA